MHHREGRELRRLLVRALVLKQAAAHHVLAGVAVTECRATAARADQLVAVRDGEDRFVLQFDGERNRACKQVAVAARPDQGVRAADANRECPDDAIVDSRSDLDLVRPRLAPDICAPRLDILDGGCPDRRGTSAAILGG